MCPLCEAGMKLSNFALSVYDDVKSDNEFKINDNILNDGITVKDSILYYDNSGGEYSCDAVKINYCPICGRKLREDQFICSFREEDTPESKEFIEDWGYEDGVLRRKYERH